MFIVEVYGMKKKISLILNILLLVLEVIGFIVLFKSGYSLQYEFYTEDSNILGLFSSLLLVICMLSKEKTPRWVHILKYMATIGLSLTLFVVVFVLIPMADFNYQFYLFEGTMLYQHFLCPLLAIITFIFFDDLGKFNKDDVLYGLTFTIIYAVVLITLNIIGVVEGPYPFLMVRNQTILVSVIWALCLLGFAYLLAYTLGKLYKDARKRNRRF